MDFAVPVAQMVAAAVACLFLYRLWARFQSLGVGVWVVAIGFVGRAFLSAVLFWVAWLRVPVVRGFTTSKGFWFFGADGYIYYRTADSWIANGLLAVLSGDYMEPSRLWVQCLALSRILMGDAISVAAYLNLAAYLGSAWLVARWGQRSGRERHAVVTLVCLSFSPSLVLWTTQPLKDTLFIFCVIAFFFGFARWVEACGEPWAPREAISATVMMVASIYAIGGLRWYYGTMLWMLFLLVAGWSGLVSRPRRPRLMGWSIGVFVMMGVALVLNHWAPFRRAAMLMFQIPAWILVTLQQSKSAFETIARGATIIEPGPLIDWIPHAEIVARGVLMFVPRFVASALGLADAGGGRGLWMFAEIDSVSFIVVIVAVGWIVWRSRPLDAIRNPLLVFLVLLLVSSLAMLYAINNFGTLFRFREMFLLPIILVPLSLSGSGAGGRSG